ncbi:MAG: Cysteine--tRNA ligase [Bacteroidota bacterium]|jgi:cysteinyl-tRNA synthetase
MNALRLSVLNIYNTLSRSKEEFKPIHPPFVGIYVCGPTVYNDVHLGNCRTFISFDIVYRYLLHLGYKVRYVRNITDAGHLENDADVGDDKISKRARLEQLEPMEIVQKYTTGFHRVMELFNNLPPSVEPTATGHIIEQIEMTRQIIKNGLAYEKNGTVYFDVDAYTRNHHYGVLSNRKLEDLLNNTRELSGQEEKKGRLDFALWIKAKPEHIMNWPSPWGSGFPGWHIECSAMSKKYLGDRFDIHGGGMDLIATHHTNEIAQSVACSQHSPVNFWMHTNMLTVNGARMSKSAGNGFLPEELFSGNHPLLERPYSPMVVRFFMLQTHYRSTLDFSNDALSASAKGFERLMSALDILGKLKPSVTSSFSVHELHKRFYEAMDDDFNTPVLLASVFDAVRTINLMNEGKESLNEKDLIDFRSLMHAFVFDVLGLKNDKSSNSGDSLDALMELILEIRTDAKAKKDFATSDLIRDKLSKAGIQVMDTKNGPAWKKLG